MSKLQFKANDLFSVKFSQQQNSLICPIPQEFPALERPYIALAKHYRHYLIVVYLGRNVLHKRRDGKNWTGCQCSKSGTDTTFCEFLDR
jgi:hypothetical protein